MSAQAFCKDRRTRARGPRSGALAYAVLAGVAAVCLLGGPALAQKTPLGAADAQVSARQDAALKEVRLDQKLGNHVPMDVMFRNEDGKQVRFGDYFGSKPVALVMIQYRCTMLCTEEMNVLMASLKELKFTPGKEFNLVIVSIDPREDAELAMGKKISYLAEYGRPEAAKGWSWLTGGKNEIDKLAASIGYHYVYDPKTDQYAHPDGVVVITPEGKIARYFFRLEYPARDLRLGLIEASRNRIGTPLDAIALLCYHYNPITGRYALAVMGLVRGASAAMVLGICAGVVLLRRRERGSRGNQAEALGNEG
ncbi:MAG: SCO family protein [Actinomycetota bacterium]